MARRKPTNNNSLSTDDPLWYKDAIIYELHVRAFCDSDGDGIGDFQGLCSKLDYLQDLGVTAIWLLPFYPSPLKDDGYDIADYFDVHPNYGTLRDFRAFLKEAHRRGLRVITELVVNHTSSDHSWFQRARRAPSGSPERDFYVWSDDPNGYQGVRIIFKDFETSNWAWDPVAEAYYWHRFYSHQPDLNFDNPKVHRAILKVVDFWLGMGVDGLRLDAVPYLYQREGTSCENLPETHDFLRKLRRHVESKYPDRMLLAEANQWPEDAAAYFGNGDECHMAFHFPLMPRMFMALHQEDRFPILDILEQTPNIPNISQWAIFLRNHDELTLEMVTDEDRDYMYRVYAHDRQARINLGIRRRLAPLLENRRKTELMNGLLLSMPGTPVLYYADEIGMGDNMYLGDRNGVRTPMQWSGDRNAGFSRANPQKLYLPIIVDPEYHYEAINVETQQQNPHSLLWWTKRVISLRKEYPAFGRGQFKALRPRNAKILAFTREYDGERLLVVANLSRFVQYTELDLSEYRGMTPVELFGRTVFPPIGKRPYALSLGAHNFYWFALREERGDTYELPPGERELPVLEVSDKLNEVFAARLDEALQALLPRYLQDCRWFAAKARRIKSVTIKESIAVCERPRAAHLMIAQVSFEEQGPEDYLVALGVAGATYAAWLEANHPRAVIAKVCMNEEHGRARASAGSPEESGVLYDAIVDSDFTGALLGAMARRRRLSGRDGHMEGTRTRAFGKVVGKLEEPLTPRVSQAEQSNTSVVFGDRAMMKIYRKPSEGLTPELEIGRFLATRREFANTPPLAASLTYRRGRDEPITVALLHGYMPSQGDAWGYTLDELGRFFERAVATGSVEGSLPLPPTERPGAFIEELPELVVEALGSYLPNVERLGRRTAEMHLALASGTDDPDFAPEPFSGLYQRSLYQSIRANGTRAFRLLEEKVRRLPRNARKEAKEVLGLEGEFQQRVKELTRRKLDAMRIRCHGDYHLGQVLYTGNDFVIIDFEGEPTRSYGERRLKRSSLRDVAGMLRSFHYAAMTGIDRTSRARRDLPLLEEWAEFWTAWVSAEYFDAYLKHATKGGLLPKDPGHTAFLLDICLLEKALYEMEYELNNRPEWVWIPLRGLVRLLKPEYQERKSWPNVR